MLTIIVIMPLVVAAFIAMMLHDRRSSGYVALAASVLGLLLVLYVLANNTVSQSVTWFIVAGFPFSIDTALQQLNVIALLLVAVITPIVLVYSIGFMNVPSERGRYYFEMCIFAASMMLFAISAGFITMLISWELLSLSSYLLIGFWYRNERAPDAARKAVTTVLVGDLLMFAAVLLIWNACGTLSFAAMLQQPSSPAVAVALVLVMIAAFTKSAQFPFHEWLPDATEGPAPASAFLLSSTVAKAGVFLLVLLLPLFARYDLLGILIIFGSITALIGASNALAENHIKRMLAYSAMESLGLMTIALGFDALAAAMLLFIVQTFYTLLLFMCAGAIMRANDNEDDMYRLRGSSIRAPLFIATLIGAASIAGIFPLSGFFARSGIGTAASSNLFVSAVLVLVGFASSLYIFKWMFVPIRASARTAPKSVCVTLPKSILAPIYALAMLVVLSLFAYMYLPAFLGTLSAVALGIAPVNAVLESAAALAGLAAAYVLYLNAHPYNMKARTRLYVALYNGGLVDVFYLSAARAVMILSNAVYAFDCALYAFMRGAAGTVAGFGSALRLMVNGRTDIYVSAFVVGAIAVLVLFMVW
jgi:NADH-quinone oxidoreductase subunit L